MKTKHHWRWLAWPLKIAIGGIWLVLVWIASYQILNWTPPPAKPYAPWAELLALFSSACIWLLKCLKDARNELEEEKFSAPKALALGYLNNWVKPAIDFLLKQPESPDVRFYIFLPETLGQLEDVELQTTRAFIASQGYLVGKLPVTFSNGQGGSVETVTNATGTKTIYVDFPKTMKVLMNVVNLKVSSTEPSAQAELERKLVRRFNEIVEAEVGKPESFLSLHAKIIRIGQQVAFHDTPAGF
jgi:hypothetical protein